MDGTKKKHVPAWKKLGLKLKYAKDEPEAELNDSELTTTVQNNGKKRKLVSDETTTSWTKPSSKKLKPESSKISTSIERTAVTPPPPEDDASHLNQYSLSPSKSFAPITPAGRTKPKRKSVTFTPETKTEDGDSIKTLYNSWLASHRAVDPNFDPIAERNNPALKIVVPPAITLPSSSISAVPEPTVKRKKKKKKSKSKSTLLNKQSKSNPSKSTTQTSPASIAKDDQICTYITTHHLSPSNWKFSKSRQNALLRSVFSLSALPSSYDSALLSYLRGLQGNAARSRVREMALQVRADDEMWLEGLEPSEHDKETRREDYEGAVERVRETLKRNDELRDEQLADEEWESRFRKRRRAEVILWGIGEAEDNSSHPPPAAKLIEQAAKNTDAANGSTAKPAIANANNNLGGRNGKPKRKRKVKKRNTGVPDDESSSSPGTSSSSNSSEDDTRTAAAGRVEPRKAIWDEDTSSEEDPSSSSSSSSEEDRGRKGGGEEQEESADSSEDE